MKRKEKMKKYLSIIASLGLLTTTSTTVVSCTNELIVKSINNNNILKKVDANEINKLLEIALEKIYKGASQEKVNKAIESINNWPEGVDSIFGTLSGDIVKFKVNLIKETSKVKYELNGEVKDINLKSAPIKQETKIVEATNIDTILAWLFEKVYDDANQAEVDAVMEGEAFPEGVKNIKATLDNKVIKFEVTLVDATPKVKYELSGEVKNIILLTKVSATQWEHVLKEMFKNAHKGITQSEVDIIMSHYSHLPPSIKKITATIDEEKGIIYFKFEINEGWKLDREIKPIILN